MQNNEHTNKQNNEQTKHKNKSLAHFASSPSTSRSFFFSARAFFARTSGSTLSAAAPDSPGSVTIMPAC